MIIAVDPNGKEVIRIGPVSGMSKEWVDIEVPFTFPPILAGTVANVWLVVPSLDILWDVLP